MMTEGSAETQQNSIPDSKNASSTQKERKLKRMVSMHQEPAPNTDVVDVATESNAQTSRFSRSRSRRASFPKRQLSRTDSTMMEIKAETPEPIILRRSPEVPDVSDVARNNNKDVGGSTNVIYRRRGSGSVKKKLTRTDSKLMVVTYDPENLALKIEPPSFDEDFPESLLKDFEEPGHFIPLANDIPRPSRSPPILISEHVEARKALVSRQQSLVGTVLQSDKQNKKQWSSERQQSLPNSNSCPNLLKGVRALDVGFVKHKLRSTRSSDARLSDKSRPIQRSASASNQLLQVPDIFTTSFQTSSRDSQSIEEMHRLELGSGGKHYRHSAPELISLLGSDGRFAPQRPVVLKSLSDNQRQDRRAKLQTMSDSRIRMFQSVDDPEPPPPPFTPIIGQVVEGVFLGNVESSFCERLLCKHNIGSIVDVSGCPRDAVPNHKRSNVPCACGNDSRHLRASLRLCLAEANPSDLRQMLEQTNKFIDGGRNKQRGALVSCYYGNYWSALVVMYYLMTIRGMNLRKAYSMVMMHRSDLELTSENKQFLQQVEKSVFDSCDQSLCFEFNDDNKAAFLPREAWVDESVN